ncbi:MAG: 2-C-methyl-D-erythritol 2,4-cyclodiphosphate synthase [Ignavibacteria bacterium]
MIIPFRTGFGYDVHQLTENRKLIIGGVEIPYEKGLLGHSDADVLLHAITDALLGALALGDIGNHFPDTDPKYKDADSKILLREVYQFIKAKGYVLASLDATVALQKPKIAPYVVKMREIISSLLECCIDQISVKATTTEKLGFVGQGEGAVAYATVMIMAEVL